MKLTFEGELSEVIDSMTEFTAKRTEHFNDGLVPPLELGYQLIDSDNTEELQYKLTSLGKLTVACTCPAFRWRTDSCKHIRRANGRS